MEKKLCALHLTASMDKIQIFGILATFGILRAVAVPTCPSSECVCQELEVSRYTLQISKLTQHIFVYLLSLEVNQLSIGVDVLNMKRHDTIH